MPLLQFKASQVPSLRIFLLYFRFSDIFPNSETQRQRPKKEVRTWGNFLKHIFFFHPFFVKHLYKVVLHGNLCSS